ncbi:MAG TPA: class I SAM-dependent methyltransferase [Solirubrobacteraceae bacterium]|nr:class I SAM-dependent methyltransferase [Solirubrobacteraceae bacterium]
MLGAPDRLHGTPGRFEVALCNACGMGVTLPPARAEELAAFYPGGYSPYELPSGFLRLVSGAIQSLQRAQALRTAPLECLTAMTPGRLLDVGCGRGDLGAWMIGRGWSVTGVEPSPGACEVARSRGLDARVGVLAEAGIEQGAYDAVVFRQSLEHVPEPAADIRRAHAALRPGGVVIVSVPNFGGWQRRRFGGAWFHLDLPRHRTHFDAGSLRALLARGGFVEVQTSTSTTPVGLPASIQYALAGRCMFPQGLSLRAAVAACALLMPLTWLANRLAGEGDVLHAVARRA